MLAAKPQLFSAALSPSNAAQGSGDGKGKDISYSNSQVLGNSVTIKSADDTNLKGAVVAGNTVKTDIGGNLNIESLQDSSSFKQESKNAGGSLTISPAGVPTGGSLSVGKTNIDSNFASVNEQSGIKAGDGGFQVDVKGKTDLKGGAITSTQAAIDNKANSYDAKQGTTLTDLTNSAQYKADGFQVSAGVGTAKGASASVGQDSGNASSTTTAAISGVAGHTAARTGDAQQGIAKIFDADKVSKEVNAQVAITGEFGKQATKAVGDYAGKKKEELEKQEAQARKDGDPEKAKALKAEAAKWEEGGAYRVALHTAVGGLTGGAGGAMGAGASSAASPGIDQLQTKLEDQLKQSGMSQEGAKALASLAGAGTATVIGAAASGGSAAGGAAALNADVNNRQLHPGEVQKAKELAAKSGGKFTQAQIEEQMRLMGNDQFKEAPNTVSVLVGGQALRDSVNADPSMPKVIQGEVAVEIPGQTNTALQQYIQANTKDTWIPGSSPYTNSDPAKNSPVVSNKGPDLATSQCANGDMACASGVGRQQNAPLSDQTKEAIADGASIVNRGAGIVGSTALVAAEIPGPHQPGAAATVVTAAGVGFLTDVIEQVARPNVGKGVQDFFTAFAQNAIDNRIPLIAPVTNEVKQAWRESGTSKSFDAWISEEWAKALEKMRAKK